MNNQGGNSIALRFQAVPDVRARSASSDDYSADPSVEMAAATSNNGQIDS